MKEKFKVFSREFLRTLILVFGGTSSVFQVEAIWGVGAHFAIYATRYL